MPGLPDLSAGLGQTNEQTEQTNKLDKQVQNKKKSGEISPEASTGLASTLIGGGRQKLANLLSVPHTTSVDQIRSFLQTFTPATLRRQTDDQPRRQGTFSSSFRGKDTVKIMRRSCKLDCI